MKSHRHYARSAVALAASLALLHVGGALAQSAPKSNDGTLNLDEIVVTGTSEGGSKMKKSVAVSTLDGDQIINNQPTNASDVLSSIPGIHVESSGGAGNANVTVRGLPISAGGSRYVQFQEDGLPVLLFGDISFATPDTFLRVDSTLDRVEAVRGGSGSTLTTNAPGGIINFITKTGEEEGGSIGITSGLGFQEDRFDFNYGGKISDKTRFFVGGYFDEGKGPRDNGASAIGGGQIKGNITHDLDNGFVRLNFKHLDDQLPLFMPTPVNITNGKISTIAGFDPRTYTGYSPNWGPDTTLTASNGQQSYNVNSGQTVVSNAIGLEGQFKLANGWNLSEKFRQSANSGQWIGLFPGSTVGPAAAGTSFATGPNAGQSYSGPAFNNIVFNTSLNNLGATTNDFKLSKVFDQAGGGKLTTTAGLFLNVQHVDLTWNFNNYLMQGVGSNASLLKNSTTNAGGYAGPAFGGCCSRDIEATYRTTSPYALLTYEKGPLTLDGSVRLDNQAASGSYNLATPVSATSTALAYQPQNAQAINYTVHHTEYSFGANYLADKNTAFFARVSDGASFNADRIMFASPLNGTAPIPINTVQQYEAGMKLKSGNLSSFITLFDAKTVETNYDATTQISSANTYNAKGIEFEEGLKLGHFHLSAGATYTDAKVTASNNPYMVGLAPNRQAKFVYQFGPSYIDEKINVGVNVVGTTSSLDAQGGGPGTVGVTLPAYAIVNLHASYMFDEHTSLALGVYNMFNTLAFTEADNGYAARAVNGRSAKVTLKYQF